MASANESDALHSTVCPRFFASPHLTCIDKPADERPQHADWEGFRELLSHHGRYLLEEHDDLNRERKACHGICGSRSVSFWPF